MRFELCLAPTVFLALLASSCVGRDDPPWVGLLNTGKLAILLDTSDIEDSTTFDRIVLRFDYPEPQLLPDGSGHFTRMYGTWDISCADQVVRDVEIRLDDGQGKQVGFHRYGTPIWSPWKQHPASATPFVAACIRLKYMAARRGA